MTQLLHRPVENFQIAALGVVLGQLEQGLKNTGELIRIDKIVLGAQPFIDLRAQVRERFFRFPLCQVFTFAAAAIGPATGVLFLQ